MDSAGKQRTAYEVRMSDGSSDVCSSDLGPSPFAGVIVRSPHWRARGGATFEQNNVALSAFLQYVGGVTDDRIEPDVRVGSFLAADLSAKLSGSTGIWRGTDLTLTISNIFNEMPYRRSEEHTSELQSLMRIPYAVCCLKKKKK